MLREYYRLPYNKKHRRTVPAVAIIPFSPASTIHAISIHFRTHGNGLTIIVNAGAVYFMSTCARVFANSRKNRKFVVITTTKQTTHEI